jgi:hypothetical protein
MRRRVYLCFGWPKLAAVLATKLAEFVKLPGLSEFVGFND